MALVLETLLEKLWRLWGGTYQEVRDDEAYEYGA